MVAGARIARWLFANIPVKRGDLKWLIDGPSVDNFYKHLKGEFTLYIINVPKTMIKNVTLTEALVEKAKTVIWIQNDYSIWAPTLETAGESMVTKAFTARLRTALRTAGHRIPTFTWSTCLHRVQKHPGDYRYINWNALAYEPVKVQPLRRNKDAVLYYGSFREGRTKEFDRYFNEGIWVIAAPKNAEAKFVERYKFQGNLLGVIDVPKDLALYTHTLYMEDDLSHRQFHSPANRFYEALSAEMIIWVDRAAARTLETAGYEVPTDCIVDSSRELFNTLKIPTTLSRVKQAQKAWCLDPVTRKDHQIALKSRLKELLRELS